MGSKKLLPGNSVMKVISWRNKPIFTEIMILRIRQNTFLYAFDHMEFCFVIELTMDGNQVVIRPPMVDTRCGVSVATAFYTR